MVKRGRDDGDAQPLTVLPAPLESVKQAIRERCYKLRLAALNESFAAAFAGFAQSSKTAGGLAAQYLSYVAQLQAEFEDVLVPQLQVPSRAGMVYMVGTGDMGQLGLGEELVENSRPAPLDGFQGLAVCAVACGGMHSAVLTTDGRLWTWGVNDDFALGRTLPVDVDSLGTQNQTGWTPGLVEGLPEGKRVVAVAAGDAHTAALLSDGSLWAWGIFCDTSGKLAFSADVKWQKTPACVYQPAAAADRLVSFRSGADHIVMHTAAGRVLTAGVAVVGRLGRFNKADCDLKPSEVPHQERIVHLRRMLTPAEVPGLPDGVKAIGVGHFSTFAITDQDVYAWGLNNYGQLGIPAEEAVEVLHPVRVPSLHGRGVVAIWGGDHHTLALTQDGQLLSFGRPTYGRLGRADVDVNSDEALHMPEPVPGFGDDPVTHAAAGLGVSACVTRSGACYSWGYGDTSMLGKSGDQDEATPFKLAATHQFPASGGFSVSVGGQHMAWLAALVGDVEGAARGAPKRKMA